MRRAYCRQDAHRSWLSRALCTWRWSLVCLSLVVILSGCAARSPQTTATDTEALQAAYRAGLQTALRGYQEQMLDHDFPYTNWSPPLVQRVWLPARITNGVFIPGHMEDVIITPGAWKREFSAPLSTHQSTSQTRLYSHDRPVGNADRMRSTDAEADHMVSRSRVPAVPRGSPKTTPSQTWAELPRPSAQWGVTP